jgi:hypothetical protein
MWVDESNSVVVETLSHIDKEIVSFDLDLFGCFMGAAHSGEPILVAHDEQTMQKALTYAGRQPRLLLVSDVHFNEVFQTTVRRIGNG